MKRIEKEGDWSHDRRQIGRRVFGDRPAGVFLFSALPGVSPCRE